MLSLDRRTGVERLVRRLVVRGGGVVERPVGALGGATFPLAHLRDTPPARRRGLPVLVVPGGPGLASAVPYRTWRRRAAALGIDALMVEHRGVGLSRRDAAGRDLPVSAVTVEAVVDDLAAVLDDDDVERAVVYGASYGTYLAQAFAVRHPRRVAALVLDSPMLSVVDDVAAVRAHRRRLLWDGEEPALAGAAAAVRELGSRARSVELMAELTAVVTLVHELAGPDAVRRLVTARGRGRVRWLWSRLAELGASEASESVQRFLVEPDLVAGIAYRQLGFGQPPDGGPLDPQLIHVEAARNQPAFAGEPFDLVEGLRRAAFPVVVLSGERDLTTPRPIAVRAAGLAPQGLLVELPATGHSALDVHREASLFVARAVADGVTDRLRDPAELRRLHRLPHRGLSPLAGAALRALVRVAT
ncbi:alpha/beta fold hydrolase [Streptomyces sp. NP160]|uniref:alpha/beta hydrolase n=1 Tax=Streptomyces sp. NP160 TaxID=2586637 RepID=UPI0015D5A712|nr:alpha/beta fold hydrolase [Streptomyces sp. NP160]